MISRLKFGILHYISVGNIECSKDIKRDDIDGYVTDLTLEIYSQTWFLAI